VFISADINKLKLKLICKAILNGFRTRYLELAMYGGKLFTRGNDIQRKKETDPIYSKKTTGTPMYRHLRRFGS
jgi:hypothetical protein